MVGNDLANRKDRGSQLAKDYLVQRRLSYLDNLVGNTSYGRQKTLLEKEFLLFLKDECNGRDMMSVSPEDIRRFLVLKDDRGKTQIHAIDCLFLGKQGRYRVSQK